MTIITTTKTMRPRDPDDHYPTPLALCESALRLITPCFSGSRLYILDPGCGSGVWGAAARDIWGKTAHITGIDTRNVSSEPLIAAKYDLVTHGDFTKQFPTYANFDLVIGNPPYKAAESFVRTGWQSLNYGGSMIYLLRLAFLEGQARQRGLWRDMPPRVVAVCGKRPSFTGDRKTDATAYAVYIWQKTAIKNHARHAFPVLTWLDWDYENPPKTSRNKGATA